MGIFIGLIPPQTLGGVRGRLRLYGAYAPVCGWPPGEFYTPRAVTDFMAQVIKPQIGEAMAIISDNQSVEKRCAGRKALRERTAHQQIPRI